MYLKKGLILLPVLLGIINIQAQIKIDGKLNAYQGSEVALYVVQEGALKLYDSHQLEADSIFSFSIDDAPSGFYYLGSSKNTESVFDNLYLKAGQHAKLTIENQTIVPASLPNHEAFAYRQNWEMLKNEALDGAWTKARELEHVESILTKHHNALVDFISSLKSNDQTLNLLMQLMAQADFDMFWMRNFSMVQPEVKELLKKNSIMQELYNRKLASADILRIKDGAMAASMLPSFKAYWQMLKVDDYLSYSISVFDNDTLKGRYLTNHIIQVKISGSYLDKLIAEYGNLLVTDEQRNELKAYQSEIIKFAEGAEAFDFAYPDSEGKMHALSDYKGKVVLVDVWATWCAPCKTELPHLEKLIEHYQDNPNVVFIGVSIDKRKDKAKWEKFTKDHDMKGIQLLADYAFESDIIYDYEISGVPRFMLFDKAGKIVSVNAPRPSNPQLKEIIDEYL